MARPEPSAQLATAPPKFGLNLGLAIWGVSAATALFIALYAATTKLAVNAYLAARWTPGMAAGWPKPALARGRPNAAARIATLERSLDGITGLIARVEQAERTAPTSSAISAASGLPAPSAAPAETTPTGSEPDEGSTSSAIAAASGPPAPSAAPVETTPTRSELDEESTSSATAAASAPPALSAAPVQTTPPEVTRTTIRFQRHCRRKCAPALSAAPVRTTPTRGDPDDGSSSSATAAASVPPAPSAAPMQTTPTR